MPRFKKKASRITLVTLLVYALLVATHEGEFWPFSIYPMFSQAGNPWTRALVTDVTDLADHLIWEETDRNQMAGEPIPVSRYGVDQIDFSNYVSKTNHWNSSRKQALITMFGRDNLAERRLMIMKAEGRFTENDEVEVRLTPFLLLTRDSVYTNPLLPDSRYQSVSEYQND